MANIITNTEVFEFMKTEASVATNQGTMITNLITRMQSEIEEQLNRLIHSETKTDILFQHGLNCEIYEEKLFLKGIYRDLYSISAITEEGTALTAVVDYNDSNDYYLDAAKGILLRNEQYWSMEPYAIKLTGKVGMVNSDDSARQDWKEIMMEVVASKSGLWKERIITEGGLGYIERIRASISKDAKDYIAKFDLRGF